MPGYGDDDAEQEITLTSVRTSRKARVCATCGGDIRPGQQYARIFFPAYADTYVTHASTAECWDAGQIEHELPGQAVLNPEFLPGGSELL